MTLRTPTSRRRRGALAAAVGLALALPISGPVAADPVITLAEWAINIDGTVNNPGSTTPDISAAAFNDATGLGTVTVTISNDGKSHSVLGFFDHEIDEVTNTFSNEIGAVSGAPSAGQSWEIDEPGFLLTSPGDIYTNFAAGVLDNTNNTRGGGVQFAWPDDVSMAMGWALDFSTLSAPLAQITFAVSPVAPTGGFYLTQTDPDSKASIYLSSTLAFSGFEPMPEPGTLALLGLGLGALAGLRRSKGIA